MDLHRPRPTHPAEPARRRSRTLLGGSLLVALVIAACSGDSGGSGGADDASAQPAASEADTPTQPTAPDSQRVDLDTPSFSDPTAVDNPLFPIGELHSAVLLGNEERHPLRIETVLLPEPKVIEVDGQPVETLVSQFVSYVDGRIHEVALDWYAQDDAGNVWYFGEDVFNYEDGVVADTDGTWIAGEDGPVGMIMPADPQVGQAYRPENIPDFVFEEVVVKAVDLTVDGPRGPVAGAMVGTENHLLEGHFEDKTFAPGYGEFRSGVGANLEALALAVPTDARPGGVPAELETISRGAAHVFAAAEAGDWEAATSTLGAMNAAWAAHKATGAVPPLLDVQMSDALDALAGNALVPAVADRNPEGARNAALDVEMAALDLQLQYRPPAEIDLGRFGIWADQILVDAASDEPDAGLIAGDVTSLEWTWDRIAHTLDQADADALQTQLEELRAAADDEDTAAAAEAAPHLVDTISRI
ncbi:MAG TPA: hypothetical protein VFR26_09625 [Acidimicrobiales bacterium]|nr:hypothetical protein [Acidimicrobiales bacterium]